ncbi:MAG TPA: carboxypeptidase-like regulatory domain-containing protein [Pyrinomonadaceae bacterium]|nr:carboxypeptidase-like regulatory domain-containing protein [Pyrinomonadaceae bacterium]
MTTGKWLMACLCVITASLLTGCSKDANKSSQTTGYASPTPVSTSSGGETGVEKVKPAPGTGNVQGKVLYNGKPVANIEVKLCEKFSQYIGGCSGKTYTAKTDEGGEYVITNAPPGVYEGLLARVFETDSYVFAATGIAGLSSTKYEIAADKTLFIAPTNLFKGDLKVLNPKAGSKVSSQNLELKWEPYPDAAYYKFSIYPEEMSVTSPYINERVEATTFPVDKPLPKGTYRWQVNAYNGSDQKLSESGDDIKFTITDGAGS